MTVCIIFSILTFQCLIVQQLERLHWPCDHAFMYTCTDRRWTWTSSWTSFLSPHSSPEVRQCHSVVYGMSSIEWPV